MIIWIRNLILIFFILSIVYAILTFISRRKSLEKINSDYLESDKTQDKSEFVAKGIAKYNRSLRAKLIILVYLIPLIILAGLTYLAQST